MIMMQLKVQVVSVEDSRFSVFITAHDPGLCGKGHVRGRTSSGWQQCIRINAARQCQLGDWSLLCPHERSPAGDHQRATDGSDGAEEAGSAQAEGVDGPGEEKHATAP